MAHVPVRLSSEMENTVTVDYATADGTAHEGDDYVAAAGTLTFAPHERVKYVDVTINDDGAGEPDETFFLNLSNESSGTMVDPQARGDDYRDAAPASTASASASSPTAVSTAAATATAATSTTPATTASAASSPAAADPVPRAARARAAPRGREAKGQGEALLGRQSAQSWLAAIAAGPRDRPDSAPGCPPAPRIPGQSRRRPALGAFATIRGLLVRSAGTSKRASNCRGCQSY